MAKEAATQGEAPVVSVEKRVGLILEAGLLVLGEIRACAPTRIESADVLTNAVDQDRTGKRSDSTCISQSYSVPISVRSTSAGLSGPIETRDS